MKKVIAFLLVFVMLLGLTACAKSEPAPTEPTVPPTMAPYEPNPKAVYVLIPNTESDWEMAVASAAQEKADELNAAGGMTVNVLSYGTVQEQTALMEDILAKSPNDGSVGVVLMPAGEETAAALQKLLDANISYALAGTIPQELGAASVCNVFYDQYQIGAAAAAYLVNAGLTQKNDVVIMQGFDPEDAQRTEGFKMYLEGKLEVDGAAIETPWDDFSTISYSDMKTDSRESAKEYFEAYMGDADQAYTGYFAAWDDTYVLAMLDALEDELISDQNRSNLFAMEPTVTGFGASAELMDKLSQAEGSEDAGNIGKFSDINSIVYDSNMLQTALQAMADYMLGQIPAHEQKLSVQWAKAPVVAETEE